MKCDEDDNHCCTCCNLDPYFEPMSWWECIVFVAVAIGVIAAGVFIAEWAWLWYQVLLLGRY